MATLLLQAAGAALGGAVAGPLGAVLGRAAGGLAGSAIDASLFGTRERREGPRLDAARIMQADEGGGIARVYGTARVAGQVIWATRFEEEAETERQGGKGGGAGGVEVTSYSYFANFAVGLCEGPISGIRRIWADGEELDRGDVTVRLHRGGEDQSPDPLIEARQGEGRAPAYRGLAYLVFERLALARWGNRVPQISCEVMRAIGDLEGAVKAITIIPGASEHGLDPRPVREAIAEGEDRVINRTVSFGPSDWSASMDEMQAVMPALERAALVSAWFADDLRAGHASLRPKVEISARRETEAWRVGDLTRGEAQLVSLENGAPAYGGTPSDAGVLRALAELRARGLAVTFYPFVLMDVPAGNGLPDPYGGLEQAAFPWRGRMTLDRAESETGTADRTAGARADIDRFVGTASPGDFAWRGERLTYRGPPEWSYRRMIFHQAHLARRGGAAAFVIGSEMRGLTRLRDEAGRFPFVEALIAIAGEVKAMMPDAVVTYAADWSEYAGYRPADGAGEMRFNLDPLWASPAIDVIGIDNYLPLSDWRGEGDPGGGVASPYDRAALTASLDTGEWFDWYYASAADRRAGRRTPITDGAGGTPFVYRDKDMKGWWSNHHRERGPGGAETGEVSPYVPMGKPIWFTEIGCPAIDRGGNQPNVFTDPKSSESHAPYHSRGFRDDLAQRRFLEAALAGWEAGIGPGPQARNPISPVYGGPMVEPGAIHVWTWDARPYPAFPARSDLWSDGANWRLGHWLNGRLANAPADALIAAILKDHGIAGYDVSGLDGLLGGYVIEGPRPAREDVETILSLVGAIAFAGGGDICFRSLDRRHDEVAIGALVDGEGPLCERLRAEAGERPDEIAIGYLDPDLAFQPAVASAARSEAEVPRTGLSSAPAVMDRELAARCAARLLAEADGARETATFALAPNRVEIEPGDVLSVTGRPGQWLVTRIETGAARKVEARRLAFTQAPGRGPEAGDGPASDQRGPIAASRPAFALLDLPLLPGRDPSIGALALSARPWMPYAIDIAPEGGGLRRRTVVSKPAVMGRLEEALMPGPAGRRDPGNRIAVRIARGGLYSVSHADLLSGANAAAIVAEDGRLEVLQFLAADEIEPGLFRLTGLLRGQAGTEGEAALPFAPGSRFVLLNEAVEPLLLTETEIGQPLDLRFAPIGRPLDDPAVTMARASLGLRAVRPYAPVHLSALFEPDGAVRLGWIRRTRVGGDSWQAEDVPLGEEREIYRLRVRGDAAGDGGGVFAAEVSETGLRLSPDAQIAAFSRLPDRLTLEVAQVSPVWGPGVFATRSFERPGR
ncbi:hypothetical protein DYI37_07775 [Fulvimarina endophytica]|uniref:Host specificity protein n=1 Tax=Fulvimarina endophytica TaxID=2293836 RepID=A0A371X4T6_9HYPH|nr:glycoside hydrolase/phage tail family protein [Fulvimarina endophytica]RFC64230.1 hypothetical protein DYI37_07775 [Fulvimarina endophytica]